MIITRTPLRISLLGGGTDYPSWSSKHGGIVVGGAINHYSYMTVRKLPPYHDYKSRVVYSQIEHVINNSHIEHRAINACIKYMRVEDMGLEIFHAADMPSKSGTGSSSSFVVGLLKAIASIQGQYISPKELAESAIYIEQTMMGETVGCQDQVFAAYGGLNKVTFATSGDFFVEPIPISKGRLKELNDHLMLFYTRISRKSSDIAKTYATTLDSRQREQHAMANMARQSIDVICDGRWEKLGELIDQSWRIKSSMSSSVSNADISSAYTRARIAGAWGGKITGAGGGGCMLLVVPPDKHEYVKKSLSDMVHIPFNFEFDGSVNIFHGN